MTRTALAVLFFAAMTLAVTNANAQCSSCNQSAPVFAQSYAAPAPTYSAPAFATQSYQPVAQTYASYQPQPQSGCSSYSQGVAQTYTAMPVQTTLPVAQSSGCSGCSSVVASPVGYSSPAPVYTPAPTTYAPVQSAGCSSCGTSSYGPAAATFVANPAPVATGCSTCNAQPQRRVLRRSRRNNCCN
jgi:hypothetical protein